MESLQNTVSQSVNEGTSTEFRLIENLKIEKLDNPLQIHMGTHENFKSVTVTAEGIDTPWNKFKCQYCPKSFEKEKGLKQHYHVHSTNKPFQCQVCGRSYTELTSLSRHRRCNPGCQISKKSMKRSSEESSDADSNESKKRVKTCCNLVSKANLVLNVTSGLRPLPTCSSDMKLHLNGSESLPSSISVPRRIFLKISKSKNLFTNDLETSGYSEITFSNSDASISNPSRAKTFDWSFETLMCE